MSDESGMRPLSAHSLAELRDIAKGPHCKEHGDWDANKASGCPDCVAEMRQQLRDRDARIAELERALADCEHQTHSLRVWNGQGFDYHPPQAARIARIARAAIEKATNQ